MNSTGPSSDGTAGSGSASPGLDALAAAIALAENVTPSANNPGALALGDQGNGVLNSAGVTIFATLEEGEAALVEQLTRIENGVAKYLSPNMTIAQFAVTWTGNDNPAQWAATVAQALGVSTDTTIGEILKGGPQS